MSINPAHQEHKNLCFVLSNRHVAKDELKLAIVVKDVKPQDKNNPANPDGLFRSTASSEGVQEPHPDQKYITAFIDNDRRVQWEMYKNLKRDFVPLIEAMVLKNSGTLAEADELFQNSMVALYDKAMTGTLVLTRKLDCYLYGICRNQWMTKLNHKKKGFKEISRHIIEHYSNDGFEMSAREAEAMKKQRIEFLWEMLSQLGKSAQEVELLLLRGKSPKEIAQILNKSNVRIRTLHFKTQNKLRALAQRQNPHKDKAA
jgi:RNA polymerase sigma factor (sigma-70 family)